MKLSKKPKESTREQIYKVIKENIISLKLLPGQQISEIDLSEQLGVSRTPIREAFIKLSEEGLIEIFPQKGTVVSKIDLTAAENAFFMRRILEENIMIEAIKNSDEKLLNELDKNLYLQKGAIEFGNDLYELTELDNQFHRIIYESVERENIWDTIQSASAHAHRIRYFAVKESKIRIKNIDEHLEIYEIIKNRKQESIKNILELHLHNYINEVKSLKENYQEYFK